MSPRQRGPRKPVSNSLQSLINKIDEPNRSMVRRVVREYGPLFRQTTGSRCKHQAWPGGYLDHVTEVMNRMYYIHICIDRPMGRIDALPRIQRYSLSDALLCAFCHDAEKPFIQQPGAWPLRDVPMGPFDTKAQRSRIRSIILQHWGLRLDPQHMQAIELAEGVRDCDYSPDVQMMTPLGYAVHMADLYSAVYGQFPLTDGDPFTGARRCNRDAADIQHRPA